METVMYARAYAEGYQAAFGFELNPYVSKVLRSGWEAGWAAGYDDILHCACLGVS